MREVAATEFGVIDTDVEEGVIERLFRIAHQDDSMPALYVSFKEIQQVEGGLVDLYTASLFIGYRLIKDKHSIFLKRAHEDLALDTVEGVLKSLTNVYRENVAYSAKRALGDLMEVAKSRAQHRDLFICCPTCGNANQFTGSARVTEYWIMNKYRECIEVTDSGVDNSPEEYICASDSCSRAPADVYAYEYTLVERD
jgi:hypothetical protein